MRKVSGLIIKASLAIAVVHALVIAGAAAVSHAASVAPAKPAVRPVSLPAWGEFVQLLGQPKDSQIVRQFAARYGLKAYAKGDSGGFDNFGTMPFSLLFRGGKISRVVVTLAADQGEKRPIYTAPLPYGLKLSDKPADVIKRLGPAEVRFRDEWLLYKKRCLWINFQPATHRLSEIDIDDPHSVRKK